MIQYSGTPFRLIQPALVTAIRVQRRSREYFDGEQETAHFLPGARQRDQAIMHGEPEPANSSMQESGHA